MKRCVDCGRAVKDKSRFCPGCGSGNLIFGDERSSAGGETSILPVTPPSTQPPPPVAATPPSFPSWPPPVPPAPSEGPPRKPIGENPWFWVGIGTAILLVAAGVFVLIWFLMGADKGTDELADGSSTHVEQSATDTGNDKTSPPPSSQVSADLKTSLSSVNASSVASDDGKPYLPSYVYDGVYETCWAEKRGTGQYLEFYFNKPVLVEEVRAIPGYKKFNIVDRYLQNRKPRQVSLTFDNGSTQVLPDFDLASSWVGLDWQTRRLTTPVSTKYVKVTILSTYPGEDMGSNHPATSDVSISEFHFWGK